MRTSCHFSPWLIDGHLPRYPHVMSRAGLCPSVPFLREHWACGAPSGLILARSPLWRPLSDTRADSQASTRGMWVVGDTVHPTLTGEWTRAQARSGRVAEARPAALPSERAAEPRGPQPVSPVGEPAGRPAVAGPQGVWRSRLGGPRRGQPRALRSGPGVPGAPWRPSSPLLTPCAAPRPDRSGGDQVLHRIHQEPAPRLRGLRALPAAPVPAPLQGRAQVSGLGLFASGPAGLTCTLDGPGVLAVEPCGPPTPSV